MRFLRSHEGLGASAISRFSHRTSIVAIMICSSCRRTLLSRLPNRVCSTSKVRYNSGAPSTSPSPRQPSGIGLESSKTTPSAIASNTPGISQPLSTSMLPSTSSASRPNPPKARKKQTLVGSIPGGMPLNGLGYLQAHPTILAKEDDEYPDWLWTLLAPEPGAASKGVKSAADIAGRSQLFPLLVLPHSLLNLTLLITALPRAARDKYTKKQAKLFKDLPKAIPLHEQSKDLTGPGEKAEISQQRRDEVVHSSRIARRKAIKEENFLRGM
jgi:large subunit ribosomal protein L54